MISRHRSGGALAPLIKAAPGEDLAQGFVLLFLFSFFLLVQLKLLHHKAGQEGRVVMESLEVQGVEFSSWTPEQSSH